MPLPIEVRKSAVERLRAFSTFNRPEVLFSASSIDITQNTRHVCFLGGFTAGKNEILVGNGKLDIRKSGDGVKFVEKVQQITFSADYARKTGQKILYITERAVFELQDEGIVLTEIAPGVDLERDVIVHMGFRPVIAQDLKEMDTRLFFDAPRGIRSEIAARG